MHFSINEHHVAHSSPHGLLTISSDPEQGYRPVELFVSSLAGCSGTLLKNLLHKKRITYSSLSLEVHITRDETRANRITSLDFESYVDGSMTEKQRLSLATLVIENCGMIQSVIDTIAITFTIHSTHER
ncbi:OsmC family protein [Exiguobacterium indicum]|uniref:OsmC family protein n=1 Tax=Exiguobacterium indicum TaxID=296995 RepID=A0ABU8EJC5_9BACL|nr:OsmC family protein [Exiguobacterium sp. TBG-PICH-001]MBF8153965.1 OsmC family protein [Exiguobacterium sp. TBG-PICH-001]